MLKYFDEPLRFLVSPIIDKLYPVSGPNPVLNVTPIVDSTNVTLEWPRPEGRIETYAIRWWPVENPQDIRSKNVTESNDVTSVLFEENSVQRVLVGDLMPGVQYSFVIYTVSYNLFSDITNLTTRTSKFLFSQQSSCNLTNGYVSLFRWIVQLFHRNSQNLLYHEC